MTYPNDQIPELVGELDGWDQVVGARTSEQGTARFLRAPAKWFIRKLAGYLTGVRIPDLNSGFPRLPARRRRPVLLPAAPRVLLCHHARPWHFSPTATRSATSPSITSLEAGEFQVPLVGGHAGGICSRSSGWCCSTSRSGYFGPPAAVLGIVGLGKLVYDLVTKDFRVAGNTFVLLGIAALLGSWSVCSPTCSSRSTSGATT